MTGIWRFDIVLGIAEQRRASISVLWGVETLQSLAGNDFSLAAKKTTPPKGVGGRPSNPLLSEAEPLSVPALPRWFASGYRLALTTEGWLIHIG